MTDNINHIVRDKLLENKINICDDIIKKYQKNTKMKIMRISQKIQG